MTARKSHCAPIKQPFKSNLLDGVFEQRLLLYTLAAGATLAGCQSAQAEVVFTPSSEVYQRHPDFFIDMDNDGSMDFYMTTAVNGCGSSSHTCFSSYKVLGVEGLDNEVAYPGGAVEQQAALRKGAMVGVRHNFFRGGRMAFYSAFSGAIGSWVNVQNRYLGVKFQINGETHYGWIGFRSVTAPPFIATFRGWAYETEPNKPIRAGDTGANAPEPSTLHPAGPTSLEMLSAGHVANAAWRRRRPD